MYRSAKRECALRVASAISVAKRRSPLVISLASALPSRNSRRLAWWRRYRGSGTSLTRTNGVPACSGGRRAAGSARHAGNGTEELQGTVFLGGGQAGEQRQLDRVPFVGVLSSPSLPVAGIVLPHPLRQGFEFQRRPFAAFDFADNVVQIDPYTERFIE